MCRVPAADPSLPRALFPGILIQQHSGSFISLLLMTQNLMVLGRGSSAPRTGRSRPPSTSGNQMQRVVITQSCSIPGRKKKNPCHREALGAGLRSGFNGWAQRRWRGSLYKSME